MANRIDALIYEVENRIQGGDGSPDCQDRINEAVLTALKEISSILRTCERNLG